MASQADQIHSHSHLFNITFSFINAMSLKCAVELGIPDTLQRHVEDPLTLAELGSELNIPTHRAQHLARLMRHLQHLGLVAQRPKPNGLLGYALTPSSLRLCDGFGSFVRMVTSPPVLAGWHVLSAWMRGEHGDAPSSFHAANGVGVWEYAEREPEFNELFNRAMGQESELVVGDVVAKCGPVLDGVRSLVDVGGGNGSVCRAIAEAYPHVSCVVYDLPHVVEGLPVTERVKYVGGDMFQWVPPADVVMLKYILHDYNDEDCIMILKQCKKAISQTVNGKVIVVDMVMSVVKDGETMLIENQRFIDLQLMTALGGKEREEHELKEIFDEAGFTNYKITPIIDFLCLIEIFP